MQQMISGVGDSRRFHVLLWGIRMTNAMQLYGSLILTILGFILPVLTILLSLFPEGTKVLYAKLESERKQSEDNILTETHKWQTESGLDYVALGATLKTLKKKKRRAERKLDYLKPARLIVKTAIPFSVCLAMVFLALQSVPLWIRLSALVLSVLFFAIGAKALLDSVTVLVEVSEIVNEAKRRTEDKVIELLSTLVEQSGTETLFIKEEKLFVFFNQKRLSKDGVFDFAANRKHDIAISINNNADVMAKTVEFGMIVPKGFLIESTPNLRIYAEEETQIVRFQAAIIHAHENHLKGKMGITFLTAGSFEVKAFLKGENVKYQKFPFTIRVVA